MLWVVTVRGPWLGVFMRNGEQSKNRESYFSEFEVKAGLFCASHAEGTVPDVIKSHILCHQAVLRGLPNSVALFTRTYRYSCLQAIVLALDQAPHPSSQAGLI